MENILGLQAFLTKGSILTEIEKEKGEKTTQTDLTMRDFTKTMPETEKVKKLGLMEQFMSASTKTICLTVKEKDLWLMGDATKELGLLESPTDSPKDRSQMVPTTRANSKTANTTEKVLSSTRTTL